MLARKYPFLPSTIQKMLFVLLILVIILGLFSLSVHLMEEFLVVDRPLPHADALVVMAGETKIRLPAAAELYTQGRAGKILLTNDGIFSSWSQEKQRNLYEVEWAEQTLMKMQVPEKTIVKLPYTKSGSINDALNTRKYIQNHRIRSIIIVTSDYHSRRSLWIFEQTYRDQSLRIGVYPAHSSLMALPRYRKFMTLSVEMIKYLYYRLAYSGT